MSERQPWWVTRDRQVAQRLFGRRDDLGQLQTRRCGVCHREMGVTRGFYRCSDHGLEGRIQTVEEAKTSGERCDPRYKT